MSCRLLRTDFTCTLPENIELYWLFPAAIGAVAIGSVPRSVWNWVTGCEVPQLRQPGDPHKVNRYHWPVSRHAARAGPRIAFRRLTAAALSRPRNSWRRHQLVCASQIHPLTLYGLFVSINY